MLRIDTHTVETLQLLAPGISSKDRITVKGFVHSGEVFPNFTKSERSSIWKQLKKTEGIIPSLFTFFKDLWYLESCANCIKGLITPSRPFSTIRSATRAAFLAFEPAHARFLIQTSETGFRSYSHSQGDPAEFGYRQLWLFAMRHYPKLSKIPQKKDPTAKPPRAVSEPTILYDMAVLAKRLGFQSPQIEQLIQQTPDRKIARDALLRARRPDSYRYKEEEVESLINKVTECFLKAIPLDHQLPMPSVGGRETKKESRCGHPQTQAQLQDSQFLFIDKIHCRSVTEERKATSFLVRSSVYFTFFSKLPIPSANGDATVVSPNSDLPMSPLFVSNDRSSQDQVDETLVVCTGAEEQSRLERHRLKDTRKERRQQKRANKLQRRQQREQREQQRHQSSRIDRHSIPPRILPALSSQSGTGYSEENSMEEALEWTAETKSRSAGSEGIIGGNGQGAPDMQPFLDELEHVEPIEEAQSLGENPESEGRAELGFEDEQLRRGSEEIIAEWESVEDAELQEDGATDTAAQFSSAEEFRKALDILEGRGSLRIEPGPSRAMGRKSAAMRERARFKPYDRTQRHQRASKLLPPQEIPEEDINTLPQMAVLKQTAGRITQIDFHEAQHRPLSGMDDRQSSRPMVNRTGLTQAHQQGPEETLRSVECNLQPEFPSAIHQSSRHYGMINTQSEPEALRSESVPPDASPHLHMITECPSLSPPRESSNQPDACIGMKNAISKKPTEEQDRSPGRGEEVGDLTTRSAMTIMFRARDEHGEWNRLVRKMVVDPLDPSPLERMTAKQARAHQATYYDRNLRQVPPGQCFDAAVEDGTNTIFMTFGDNLAISEETVDSITRALQTDHDDDRPAKRKQ
ncbi:hypothetical protein N7492_002183 [Penicillium capsulatum]|uniref:Uncharacterized protein n=1 Tax=Penicillium capsulatum TaxID=69766 RepID=A0A9W9LUW3_9EURO|nr:hypothetical protein N7492_002183 [Penicillium capsulatum]KAJ6123209.1 hypothetical protein N7512_005674 [Penicillium capsulatum]